MTDNSSTEIMIETEGLSKYYGKFVAVENLSFSIRKGEVVAFLGPNGAGKSTTMKMLTGYLAPSAGTAKVWAWKSTPTAMQWPTGSDTFPKTVRFMRK